MRWQWRERRPQQRGSHRMGTKEEVVTVATSLPTQAAAPGSAEEGDTAVRQRLPEKGVHGLGRIELTVKYGPRNNLIIVVHRVLNLPVEDDGRAARPLREAVPPPRPQQGQQAQDRRDQGQLQPTVR
ncbi:hypothetical protein O3P69_012233 [Scylla paramamosain]|uniref:Uncharacterized protein n=1 Tax=Scylla paramamosain TaxID=85552 RepID=A0AAW0TC78_SCYPA